MSGEANKFFSGLMTLHIARLANVAARRTRGLSPTAQEEIYSAALLAAWEQRDEFDQTRGTGAVEGILSQWFDGLVRNERKRFQRRELPGGRADALANLTADDNPAVEASRQEVIENAIAKLSPTKQKAIAELVDGGSLRTVAASTGLTRSEVKELKKRLRFQLQADRDDTAVISTRRMPVDSEMSDLSSIDRQIAAITNLEFPPKHGAECAPCVHCMWYDGYRPADRKRIKAEIADAAVREAQRVTYERKVLISAEVRHERPAPPAEPAPSAAIHEQSTIEEVAA